ncbi:hypothetical protein HK096_002200 [Nowakowskiella sp. JEL0078]|nr:hypothetical protein HK096_002200 [Nowakowskiella sp. JEL0078]
MFRKKEKTQDLLKITLLEINQRDSHIFWKEGSNGDLVVTGAVQVINPSKTDAVCFSRMNIHLVSELCLETTVTGLKPEIVTTSLAFQELHVPSLPIAMIEKGSSLITEFILSIPKTVLESQKPPVCASVQVEKKKLALMKNLAVAMSELYMVVSIHGLQSSGSLSERFPVPPYGEDFSGIEKLNEMETIQINGNEASIELNHPKAIVPGGLVPIQYRFTLASNASISTKPRITELTFFLREKVEWAGGSGERDFPLGVWAGDILVKTGWLSMTEVPLRAPPFNYTVKYIMKSDNIPNEKVGINATGDYGLFKISHFVTCVAIMGSKSISSPEQPILVLGVRASQLGLATQQPVFPRQVDSNLQAALQESARMANNAPPLLTNIRRNAHDIELQRALEESELQAVLEASKSLAGEELEREQILLIQDENGNRMQDASLIWDPNQNHNSPAAESRLLSNLALPNAEEWDPLNPPTDDVCTGGPMTLCCLPGIEVESIGSLSLPLIEEQVKKLVAIGKRVGVNEDLSPTSQLRDQKNVPPSKTWKIPASKFSIWNAEWESSVMSPLLAVIREQLGLGPAKPTSADAESNVLGNFVCTPSKLLLTLPGSKIGENENDVLVEDIDEDIGAFATLVVVLPSKYDGGQIVVIEHVEAMNDMNIASSDASPAAHVARRRPSMVKKEIEHVFDFSPRSAHGFHYAAFLKDCPFTIRPISSGYRLCLIYDLLFRPSVMRSLSNANGAAVASKSPASVEQGSAILMAGTVGAIERWTQPTSTPRSRVVQILSCTYPEASAAMSSVASTSTGVSATDDLYPLVATNGKGGSGKRHQDHLKSVLRRMCDGTGLDVFVASMILRVRGDAHSKWYHGNSIWEMGSERVREATLDGWIRINSVAESSLISDEDLGLVDIRMSDFAPENTMLDLEKEWCDDETVQPGGWNEGTAMLRIYRRAVIILWKKQETYRILCRRNFSKLVSQLNKQVHLDLQSTIDGLLENCVSRDMALGILDHFSNLPKSKAQSAEQTSEELIDGEQQNIGSESADDKTVLLLLDTFALMKDKDLFKQFLLRVLPKLLETSRITTCKKLINYSNILILFELASSKVHSTLSTELLERCIEFADVFGWNTVHEFLVDLAKRSARQGDLDGVVMISNVVSLRFAASHATASKNDSESTRTYSHGIENCFRAVANSIVALFDATRPPTTSPTFSADEKHTSLETQLLELLEGFGLLEDSDIDHRFATEFLPRLFDGPRGFPGVAFLNRLLLEDGTVASRFGFETLQKVIILLAQSTARKGKLEDIKNLVETVMEREEDLPPESDKKKLVARFKQIADCVVNHFAPDRLGYQWAYFWRAKRMGSVASLNFSYDEEYNDKEDVASVSVETQIIDLMETYSKVDDNAVRRRFAVQLLPKVFAVSLGCPGPSLIEHLLDDNGTISQRLGAENLRRLVLLLAQNRAQAGKVGDITQLLDAVLTFRETYGVSTETEAPVKDTVTDVDPVVRSVVETILSHLAAAPRTEIGEEVQLLNTFVAIGDKEIYGKFLVHILPRLLVGGNGEEFVSADAKIVSGLPSIELLTLLLSGTRRFGWESLRPMLSGAVQRALRRGMFEDVTKLIEEIVGLCSPFLPALPVHQSPIIPSSFQLMRNSSVRSVRSVASAGAYSIDEDLEESPFEIFNVEDDSTINSDGVKSHPLLDIAKELARLMAQSMIDDLYESSKIQNNPSKPVPPQPPRSATFVHIVFVILHRLSERDILKEWIRDDLLIKQNKYPLATAVVPSIYSLRAYLNPPLSTSYDGQHHSLHNMTIPEIDPSSENQENDDEEYTEDRKSIVPINFTHPAMTPGAVSDPCFITLVRGTVEVLVKHPLLRSTVTYLMQLQQQTNWDPNSPTPPPPPPTPFHPMIPPLNWRINRQIRCPRRCTDCKQLQAFLRHSAQVTARYALPHRRREHLQRELERAVIVTPQPGPNNANFTNGSVTNLTVTSTASTTDLTLTESVDGQNLGMTQSIGGIAAASQEVLGEVRCETIREGTPHALVITKTRRVYEENWRAWARATVAALIGGGPAKERSNFDNGPVEKSPQHNVGLFVPEILQLGSLVPLDFWRNPASNLPTPPSQSSSPNGNSTSLMSGVSLRRSGSVTGVTIPMQVHSQNPLSPTSPGINGGPLPLTPPISPGQIDPSTGRPVIFVSQQQHHYQQQLYYPAQVQTITYVNQTPQSPPNGVYYQNWQAQKSPTNQYPYSSAPQWVAQQQQQQQQQQQIQIHQGYFAPQVVGAQPRKRSAIPDDLVQHRQALAQIQPVMISASPQGQPVDFPSQGQHGWR